MALTPLYLFTRASDTLVKFNTQFGAVNDEYLEVFNEEIRSSEIAKFWSTVQEQVDKCLNFLEIRKAQIRQILRQLIVNTSV